MLAAQFEPVRVTLQTHTSFRGQSHPHVVTMNVTAHTRSILGRNYWQLLTDPAITQLDPSVAPLRYLTTKGLIGKPSDKMKWAITLHANQDILQVYEEGLQGEEEEEPPRPTQHDPPTDPRQNQPANPAKPLPKHPLPREPQDPLKLLRQQQAAAAKKLAAEQRQQEGKRPEQEKLRQAEAAEKQANADRLKKDNVTPNPTVVTDPEILPEQELLAIPTSTETRDQHTEKTAEGLPEGLADVNMDPAHNAEANKTPSDFTLSEEGETLSGNKELREDPPEDEINSKRVKPPPTAQVPTEL
jgi:hypothetical protein